MRFRYLTATVATTGRWHFELGDSASVKANRVRRMAGYRLDNHIVSESREVSSFRMVLVGQLAGENTFKYCYVESKLWKRREKKVETMTSIACALPNTNQKSCHVRLFYAQWEDMLSSISPASPVILTALVDFMQTRYSRE